MQRIITNAGELHFLTYGVDRFGNLVGGDPIIYHIYNSMMIAPFSNDIALSPTMLVDSLTIANFSATVSHYVQRVEYDGWTITTDGNGRGQAVNAQKNFEFPSGGTAKTIYGFALFIDVSLVASPWSPAAWVSGDTLLAVWKYDSGKEVTFSEVGQIIGITPKIYGRSSTI